MERALGLAYFVRLVIILRIVLVDLCLLFEFEVPYGRTSVLRQGFDVLADALYNVIHLKLRPPFLAVQ